MTEEQVARLRKLLITVTVLQVVQVAGTVLYMAAGR